MIVAGAATKLVVAIAAIDPVDCRVPPKWYRRREFPGDQRVIAFGAAKDDRRGVDVIAGSRQISRVVGVRVRVDADHARRERVTAIDAPAGRIGAAIRAQPGELPRLNRFQCRSAS